MIPYLIQLQVYSMMEMIGISQCDNQMSDTLLGTCRKMSTAVQNQFTLSNIKPRSVI